MNRENYTEKAPTDALPARVKLIGNNIKGALIGSEHSYGGPTAHQENAALIATTQQQLAELGNQLGLQFDTSVLSIDETAALARQITAIQELRRQVPEDEAYEAMRQGYLAALWTHEKPNNENSGGFFFIREAVNSPLARLFYALVLTLMTFSAVRAEGNQRIDVNNKPAAVTGTATKEPILKPTAVPKATATIESPVAKPKVFVTFPNVVNIRSGHGTAFAKSGTTIINTEYQEYAVFESLDKTEKWVRISPDGQQPEQWAALKYGGSVNGTERVEQQTAKSIGGGSETGADDAARQKILAELNSLGLKDGNGDTFFFDSVQDNGDGTWTIFTTDVGVNFTIVTTADGHQELQILGGTVARTNNQGEWIKTAGAEANTTETVTNTVEVTQVRELTDADMITYSEAIKNENLPTTFLTNEKDNSKVVDISGNQFQKHLYIKDNNLHLDIKENGKVIATFIKIEGNSDKEINTWSQIMILTDQVIFAVDKDYNNKISDEMKKYYVRNKMDVPFIEGLTFGSSKEVLDYSIAKYVNWYAGQDPTAIQFFQHFGFLDANEAPITVENEQQVIEQKVNRVIDNLKNALIKSGKMNQDGTVTILDANKKPAVFNPELPVIINIIRSPGENGYIKQGNSNDVKTLPDQPFTLVDGQLTIYPCVAAPKFFEGRVLNGLFQVLYANNVKYDEALTKENNDFDGIPYYDDIISGMYTPVINGNKTVITRPLMLSVASGNIHNKVEVQP